MLPYRVVIQQSLPYRQFPDSFHSRVVIVGTGVVRRGVGPLVGVRGSLLGDNQQNLSISISTLLQTISRCVLMYRHVSAYLYSK